VQEQSVEEATQESKNMIRDAQAAVRAFQEKFDLQKPALKLTPPNQLDEATNYLRVALIEEELEEFSEAIEANDLVGIADAIGDMLYVIFGAANTYGINTAPIFEEIHRTNMLKADGWRDETGKWRKPASWKAPDIAGVLRQQGYEK
jgi:predicted HAD superfamily Cof-like phosphohydrolase